MIADLRLAFRSLAKSPGFTAVALLTLTLGIGACTAVFSVVRSVLLKTPAYPQPAQIMVIRTAHLPELSDFNASPGDFLSWRGELRSFASLAAHAPQNYILTEAGEPQQLVGIRATAGLFSVYGIAPVLGRVFGPEEDDAGAEAVAVISHRLWQQHFGGTRDVLGRPLRLDGRVHTIIGVMPSGFLPEQAAAVWVPMAFTPAERSDGYRGARFLDVTGRLHPGVTVPQARAELEQAATRLAREYPGFNAGWTATLTPLAEHAARQVKQGLWILLGAVGCVLAVACFNLAGLTLARGSGRQHELAVRAALGATRMRLWRQLLTESLLIALGGGLAGWLVAVWLLDALLALAPAAVQTAGKVTLDSGLLLYAIGLSLATGILTGLLPAWQLSAVRIDSALRTQSTGATAEPGRLRVRRGLAVAQLAVAIALIACTGLVVRSLQQLTAVDPGFETAGALAVQIDLPSAQYGNPASQQDFARQLLERIRALPDVSTAGCTHALPLQSNWQVDFLLEGRPPAADGSQKAGYFSVSTGYFSAMGIRLLRGRGFAESDTADAPPVAIVNQTFAQRYFPNGDALGRRIYLMNGPRRLREIVGIVADVKQTGLAQIAPPQAYEPFAQWSRPNFTLVVRTNGMHQTLSLPALRAVVRTIDPLQPVTSVMPLASLVTGSVAAHRFIAALLSAFTVLAAMIATIGVFGLMMQQVNLRTREFGLRMALGASPGQLLRRELGQGLRLVALGTGLGLGLAAACLPLVQSLLFRTGPLDFVVLGIMTLALALIALLACWLPARRATRANPLDALRSE